MSTELTYEEAVAKARRYVHWLVDCPKCGASNTTIKPDPNENDWGWCEEGKHRFPTYTVRKTKSGDEIPVRSVGIEVDLGLHLKQRRPVVPANSEVPDVPHAVHRSKRAGELADRGQFGAGQSVVPGRNDYRD